MIKKYMKLAMLLQLVILIIAVAGMFVTNASPDIGLAALESAGWFVVCGVTAAVMCALFIIEGIIIFLRRKK